MVPTTAVCLLILAAALVVCDRYGGIAGAHGAGILRVAAGSVASISVVNLAVLVSGAGAGAGIDSLLWPDITDLNHTTQAPATSFCVLLAASAMFRLSLEPRDRDYVFTLSATVGLMLALIAVVGYAFDSQALYGVWIFTAMALHTALGFVALFAALLLLRPRLSWVALLLGAGVGSAGLRRVFPVAILGSFAFCLIASFATEAGLFTPNFRLSLLAILIMGLLAAVLLRNAALENVAEREMLAVMSDLRVSVAERDLLLRELNHRVKNNLQQITALIWFQSQNVHDQESKDAFRDTLGRVQALSAVHQLLLAGPAPSEILTRKFCDELCRNIAAAYNVAERNITIDVDVENTRLHIDVAITLGLLVNELVSNAIKHAFQTGKGGTISVKFAPDSDGTAVLTVADNGIGQSGVSVLPNKGVGMQIIDGLVKQLRGAIVWNRERGTVVTVTLSAGYEDGDAHD